MAPAKGNSGNSGNKNPHMTKRNRFNANTNVPCGHPSCQVAARSKRDREAFQANKVTPVVLYVSRARGIFHV